MIERLYEDIETMVNEIFVKYQEELNIPEGWITPNLLIELEEAQTSLADKMENVLNYQKNQKDELEF